MMLVIQQLPAWSIHAYLRFLGINYLSENTLNYYALGEALPILIDGTIIKNNINDNALYYLNSLYSCQNNIEMSTDKVFSIYIQQSLIKTLTLLKDKNNLQRDLFKEKLPFGFNHWILLLINIQEYFNMNRLKFISILYLYFIFIKYIFLFYIIFN